MVTKHEQLIRQTEGTEEKRKINEIEIIVVIRIIIKNKNKPTK